MGINPKLNVGDAAPDFSLQSDTDGQVSLEDRKGQKLVLYFYPKDLTPGCTRQACDFRDNHQKFDEAGFKIIGISPDPIERHAEFRDEHALNFTLLADPDHKMAKAYGVWREKMNYGKKYIGMVRSTFLIDEEGKIVEIQDNVRAKGHVERVIRDSL